MIAGMSERSNVARIIRRIAGAVIFVLGTLMMLVTMMPVRQPWHPSALPQVVALGFVVVGIILLCIPSRPPVDKI